MVKEKELELAKNHIKKYGATDFFFKSFEFDIIFKYWDSVKEKILGEKPHSVQTYCVKKSQEGYRIVQKLDPINAIQYTAMVFAVAEKIEIKRASENIACSYRIDINKDGQLYKDNGPFNKYNEKTINLAKRNKYILKTDISDFYNQIYLHRVENIIETCTKDSKLAKELEKFLSNINTNTSKGIPIGPQVSAILGEAIMIDIDEFIIDMGIEHTRYVDDILLFSNDRFILQNVLDNLTKYLFNNHRLSINNSKTKIYTSEEYLNKFIDDFNKLEKEKIFEKLKKLSDDIYEEKIKELEEMYDDCNPYDFIDVELPEKEIIDIKELKEDEQLKVKVEVLKEVFVEELKKDNKDISILKCIIRKAKNLRIRNLLWDVLDNFDICMPIIRDVILYLLSVTKNKEDKRYCEKIEQIILNSEFREIPYFKYCWSYYFANTTIFNNNANVIKFIKESKETVNYVLFAVKNNKISWIRQYKTEFENLGRVDRRAVLYGARVLPIDERKKWLSSIMTDDFLEQIIIKDSIEC